MLGPVLWVWQGYSNLWTSTQSLDNVHGNSGKNGCKYPVAQISCSPQGLKSLELLENLHGRVRSPIPHTTPWFRRLWGCKPQQSQRWLGERDSQEGMDPYISALHMDEAALHLPCVCCPDGSGWVLACGWRDTIRVGSSQSVATTLGVLMLFCHPQLSHATWPCSAVTDIMHFLPSPGVLPPPFAFWLYLYENFKISMLISHKEVSFGCECLMMGVVFYERRIEVVNSENIFKKTEIYSGYYILTLAEFDGLSGGVSTGCIFNPWPHYKDS